MFIVIVEKRISAKANAVDWYVLVAATLPFAPWEGLEFQLKEHVFIKLERVVYIPANGTFWVQTEPLLHPKPNANKVALELVEQVGWDKAVVEKDLKKARETLTKSAIAKLQQTLVQVQARAMMGGGGLAVLGGPTRGKRRH